MLICDRKEQENSIDYKILVIEDSEFINKTIVSMMSRFGCYDIDCAFDFKSSVEKLSSNNKYDFILLDLNLPDGYGEELVNDVKNLTDAKIIILTSETDIQMRESLFKNGILDYIVKDNKFSHSIKSIDKVIKSVCKNQNKTILVIDDSMFICKQMQSILGARNYDIKIALTAKDGMDILDNNNINTIILDIELPDKHGLDVLRDIKKEPKLSHIPIVIISGHSNAEITRDAFKLGVTYFINKPFNIEELILKVDLAIELNSKDIDILCNQKVLSEYKEAVDSSSIVSKTNSKGIITYVNDKFCEISGYLKEELIGKNHNIVRHPDMPSSIFKELWETISEKKTWQGKVKNLKKDGTTYVVHSVISPIVDYDGNIIEFISIRTDITELEYIKEELEKDLDTSKKNFMEVYKYSQEYQKALAKNNILARLDKDGKIKYVNDKFCDLCGYSKDELIGKDYSIMRDPSMSDSDVEEIYKRVYSGKTWKSTLQNTSKDGKKYHFKSTITPIMDEDNNIAEFLVIRHDITDVVKLHEELEITQKEIIFRMGEVGESRSKETGFHVKRVAEYSKLLAELCGLDSKTSNLLYTASPMHDIGKVGIPDSILMKPGKLTPDEWEVMKTHAKIGFDILKDSNRKIIKAAAIVSYTHHEKYDGTGYPNGKSGDKIHVFGRITAIADVFDALSCDRVYKKAWEIDRIVEYMKAESGKQFDPKLMKIFLKNLDKFLVIRDKFKD